MDRVWFITGASSGLGRSLAQEVLLAGERVIAAVRNLDRVEDLRAAYPETLRVVRLDLGDAAQVREAVAAARDAFGRLDVVVNNAGYGLIGALEEATDDQMQRNIDINLMGPLRVIRAALPILRGQGAGFIVNISALAAFSNHAGFSVYGGAKAALDAASQSLALELAPLGIKVVIVSPGPFRTDFISRSLERAPVEMPEYGRTSGKFARFLKGIDGQQAGDPNRAARAIIEAVNSSSPPFRLVLGEFAYKQYRAQLAGIAKELEKWESIGRDTDYKSTTV